MKRAFIIIAAVVAAVALVSWPVLADFVNGDTSLPATKNNLRAIPAGANPNFYFQASDYNALMNASLDLRTQITTGKWLGIAAQASDPTARTFYPTANYVWFDTSNKLHFYDGSDNQVAFGPVTTKGDLLGFDGTNFDRLAVGSNGTVLEADSTQTTGIKWATPLSSVTCGTGLTGGTITTTGTCAVSYGTSSSTATQGNDSRLPPAATAAGKFLVDNGSGYVEGPACATNTVPLGAGAATYTCGTVPNAALTNSTIPFTAGTGTTWSTTCTLGTSCTGPAVNYGASSNTATQGNDSRLPPTPGTQGNILYDNGSAYVALAPGSSGQFLKTQGAAANPVWATVSTGLGYDANGSATLTTFATSTQTIATVAVPSSSSIMLFASCVSNNTGSVLNSDSAYMMQGFVNNGVASQLGTASVNHVNTATGNTYTFSTSGTNAIISVANHDSNHTDHKCYWYYVSAS